VVDGLPTLSGRLSDVVGIAARDSNTSSCSGTLIAPGVVLTAKHCVCHGFNAVVLIGERDRTARQYRVARQIPEPDECGEAITNLDLDIGLLILAKPLPDVGVRELASRDVIDKAFSFRIVGFGDYKIPGGGIGHGEKRETVVPRATNDCLGEVPGYHKADADVYGCRPGAEIVAGTPGVGRDTCTGDSGGPLLVGPQFHGGLNVPDEELRLAGVASRPIKLSTDTMPCGDGGIYVRITETVMDWINKHKKED